MLKITLLTAIFQLVCINYTVPAAIFFVKQIIKRQYKMNFKILTCYLWTT
jgi:hypothetical protein